MSREGSGSLPESWELVALGELGRWYGGGTPSKANPSFWTDGKIPWVSPKDMKTDRIHDSEDHITEEAVERSATNLVPKGSVLIVTRSGILRHTLPVAVAAVDCAINQDLKALLPFEGIEPEYVAYALKASASRILTEAAKGGTTVQSIESPKLLCYEIPLAPTLEQRRIVAEIERQLSRLEVATASLKQVQASLNRYRAAVLKAAGEGRLIHLEGKQVNAHGLPEGWAWSTVEKITGPDRKCAYGVLQPGPHIDGGVPLIRVGDIADGAVLHKDMKRISPSIASQYPRTKLQGGEVLITLVGAIGRTAVVPTVLSGANVARAVGVIPVAEWVDPHWVEIWLRSPQSQAEIIPKAHEVARKTLNLEDVRATRIAIPPISVQRRIVAEVSRLTSLINTQASALQTTLQRANRLIAAILASAFRGELVAQDPNDEPASVLLERIRQAQKADSNIRPWKRRRDRKPLDT